MKTLRCDMVRSKCHSHLLREGKNLKELNLITLKLAWTSFNVVMPYSQINQKHLCEKPDIIKESTVV
jgi:hypothetical protein